MDIYRKITIERSIKEFQKLDVSEIDTKIVSKLQDAISKVVSDDHSITLGQVISNLKFYILILIDENMNKYDQDRLEASKRDLT